jgi:hypothetical protein
VWPSDRRDLQATVIVSLLLMLVVKLVNRSKGWYESGLTSRQA